MKAKYLVALAALSCVATSANAAVLISSVVPGTDPYSGPMPLTYDFETPATTPVVTNGDIRTGSSSTGAQPFGSTGNYWTVGPSTSSPGFLDLSSFAGISRLSFIWGSVDDYNDLSVIARDGTTVLATFNGLAVAPPADGDQSDPFTNPVVTLDVTGIDQGNIGGLRLSSTTEAFEVDNFAIQAIPEPGTWLLLLLGFGLVGGAMRASKRRETGPRVRYAF